MEKEASESNAEQDYGSMAWLSGLAVITWASQVMRLLVGSGNSESTISAGSI